MGRVTLIELARQCNGEWRGSAGADSATLLKFTSAVYFTLEGPWCILLSWGVNLSFASICGYVSKSN